METWFNFLRLTSELRHPGPKTWTAIAELPASTRVPGAICPATRPYQSTQVSPYSQGSDAVRPHTTKKYQHQYPERPGIHRRNKLMSLCRAFPIFDAPGNNPPKKVSVNGVVIFPAKPLLLTSKRVKVIDRPLFATSFLCTFFNLDCSITSF
jgi:hypothetical protein